MFFVHFLDCFSELRLCVYVCVCVIVSIDDTLDDVSHDLTNKINY